MRRDPLKTGLGSRETGENIGGPILAQVNINERCRLPHVKNLIIYTILTVFKTAILYISLHYFFYYIYS